MWGNDFTATLLTLALGIAIGGQIEKGRHGISYLGTQFTIGFLLTYIQGPGPAQSIVPGLQRFVSIVIGSLTAYIVVRLWPLRPHK